MVVTDKEQFIEACFDELAVYLPERGPKDLVDTGSAITDCAWVKVMSQEPIQHSAAIIQWAKKTEVRILPNFFWPGLHQDIIGFAIPVMCAKEQSRGAKEQSRGAVSRSYHFYQCD